MADSFADVKRRAGRVGVTDSWLKHNIPSWYKRILRRTYRAKAQEALRHQRDIPVEKRSATWYW